ncbi:MAG: imidazoleglycerol-phosphate dehydratase HisB [Firmicutes bacterium]|nr:imidazoleglycerol-phosphate dehydratase HisB [Alicyclobacillaceae bacterium]MCL6496586.1 imidazoleglycerol-phosphate dehydratase HisB [Bacillota bacterium]
MTRHADVTRTTAETQVRVVWDLDAQGPLHIATDLPLLTHFLTAFAAHGRFALQIDAHGDVAVDPHHLVEDVGVTLGQALRQAVGAGQGIRRFGQRWMPMDEALVLVVVDLSGRGQCYRHAPFPDRPINGIGAEVWPEFFHGFARQGGVTLHLYPQFGENAHHVVEAAFKGLGQALAEAVALTGSDAVPSTKGVL